METFDQSTARMKAFSRKWIDAWNARDLERILSLYSDDVQMHSEYIKVMTNNASGTLVGKDKLREYWAEALKRLPDLHFTHIATCMGIATVAIHYKSVGGRLAIELFGFDETGLVNQAFAHYA